MANESDPIQQPGSCPNPALLSAFGGCRTCNPDFSDEIVGDWWWVPGRLPFLDFSGGAESSVLSSLGGFPWQPAPPPYPC